VGGCILVGQNPGFHSLNERRRYANFVHISDRLNTLALAHACSHTRARCVNITNTWLMQLVVIRSMLSANLDRTRPKTSERLTTCALAHARGA
jgi:hypothetical protein